MSTPGLFFEELVSELAAALVAQRQLMQRLEATASAARMSGDLGFARQVERVTEFARLLGVRLATIERELAEVVR